MDRSTDTEVLDSAISWLDAGDPVTLVTVVRTWGSAPRRPGSLMVIHPDGRFKGSVSGGCVEDDLVQQMLKGELTLDVPRLVDYGVSAADASRIGLPCGGSLSLALESLESAMQLKKMRSLIGQGQLVDRRLCLNTGEASIHPAGEGPAFQFDENNLVKRFGPSWRLLLIGAGELSRRVAQLALTLDFAVTVCESRPEYAAGWEVSGTRLVTDSPADAIRKLLPDSHTAVLALSHTPVLDDAGLLGALDTAAFYIGALGSRKNQASRITRLQGHGVPDKQLARLHGPAGLDIGSHTPAEIALAIAAGLVAERHRLFHQPVSKDLR